LKEIPVGKKRIDYHFLTISAQVKDKNGMQKIPVKNDNLQSLSLTIQENRFPV